MYRSKVGPYNIRKKKMQVPNGINNNNNGTSSTTNNTDDNNKTASMDNINTSQNDSFANLPRKKFSDALDAVWAGLASAG